MALPSSGQISLGDIAGELSFLLSNISLGTASTSAVLNQNSTFGPDGLEPHAISEFLGYDQSASSGLKRMLGSENQGGVNYQDPNVCIARVRNFYWHDGVVNKPALGNYVYKTDGTNSPVEEGVYVLTQGLLIVGEEEEEVENWTIVVRVDSNGMIKNIATCKQLDPGVIGGSKGDIGEFTPIEVPEIPPGPGDELRKPE